MQAWRRRVGMLLLVVLVAACNGGENDTEEAPAESNETPAETPASSDQDVPQIDVLDAPVMFTLSASLTPARLLQVEGTTNLPEGARLQVVAERELSGVKWRERVQVEQGRFTAGPLGPGSGLPDGGYLIRVDLQESSVQPPEVRERIGDQGQHLSGPLVQKSRHGLGQVASHTQRYLIGEQPRRASDRAEVLEIEEDG